MLPFFHFKTYITMYYKQKEENNKGIAFVVMMVVFILMIAVLSSCKSVHHSSKSTGHDANTIHVEYELEIVDQEYCKIYSKLTGKVYLIELEKIHEVLEYDNI